MATGDCTDVVPGIIDAVVVHKSNFEYAGNVSPEEVQSEANRLYRKELRRLVRSTM
jgi:predicted ATP-grasp superfamily ATP-dependent carboligase